MSEIFWENNTFEEIENIDKNKIVIISIGSIEAHGKHLPLNTDILIPFYIAIEVCKKTDSILGVSIPFGWLPLSVEATLANVQFILKNKLWRNAKKMGGYFEENLRKMKFRYTPNIRVKGLVIGVEFKEKGYATMIMKNAMQKGLLFSDLGPYIFTLFPALNIDKKTADEGLRILSKCL